MPPSRIYGGLSPITGKALGTTVDHLNAITTALDDSRGDIKQVLHIAPTVFQNFTNIFDPAQSAITGILAPVNFADTVQFLCGAIQSASRENFEQSAKLCVQYLAPIIKNRQYNFLPFGGNPFAGATARPNEVTYSDPRMRPDAAPAPDASSPLAAEAPMATAADPSKGLAGLMVPPRPTAAAPPGGQP